MQAIAQSIQLQSPTDILFPIQKFCIIYSCKLSTLPTKLVYVITIWWCSAPNNKEACIFSGPAVPLEDIQDLTM
jgi:hypothetical protein